MDVVEGTRRIRPFQARIVDLKSTVRSDKHRLDGRQIRSDHFGGWKLVGEITKRLSVRSRMAFEIWRGHATYIAHIPVPVPTSRTRCRRVNNALRTQQMGSAKAHLKCGPAYLGVRTDRRKKELIIKEQRKHVVARMAIRENSLQRAQDEESTLCPIDHSAARRLGP